MEREVLITGIGGQGVQLAAQVLARAATAEGREVMYFGIYGGMMRGGNTDSTVVVADAPIEAPPVVSHAWSAIGMHDAYWEPLERRLVAGALVLVNDSTFARDVRGDLHVVRLPATETAAALGHPPAGSMVMLGAYCALTGIVGVESAVAAMRESLPSYRVHHVAGNEQALRAGAALVTAGAHPAWAVEQVPA